ncbi:uncharacterized protein LOC129774571 [Toxorhynchites rutilus septentrionalis]|uniref:uncharacterized protein LOC129774571 n=1 Tax=Toxorhynchites rutilus septentrionalis TaxID=329112 RepID=UPI0024785B5D|nr:uncharacterized protein LOC129774571 [Toxorhynchites rutilus septentrionalis]
MANTTQFTPRLRDISQGVDILIGAELFFSLLECQQITLAFGSPILQKTVLGYIVCGKVPEPIQDSSPTQTSHFCIDQDLNCQLERFWTIVDFDRGKAYTSEEQFCEDYFQQTVSRDTDGRYIVRLPLRENLLPLLGNSFRSAQRRFLAMERKFAANTDLSEEYQKFMDDYARLGHMELSTSAPHGPQFYLPHHAIHRPDSTTTKTRVVFDGSCRDSNRLSLNDILYTGPTVQPALYSTVVNFRKPRLVVTADVEKMFRQIWIHADDRKYQQILWRRSASEPLVSYDLKTVTYGLSSSPYHATRVLNQLVVDEGNRFPLAVPIIQSGTYVDDVLSGNDDLQTLQGACKQLIEMLKCAGFVLRKWASNNSEALVNVPRDLWETSVELEIDRSSVVKTLGLLWFPQKDVFKIKLPVLTELETVTKRVVVSEMSRLFDPLRILGPVVVNAKMFVQTLWAEIIPWDQKLSEIHSGWWKKYRDDLRQLQSVEIPRRILSNIHREYSLHCFCDASVKGYGCCIHVVSPDETKRQFSHLLTAKSRVAPLRGQTIPRLELCAALLGSQLVDTLRRTTFFTESVTMWTDSTIVLHWIKSPSHCWKVFVSNRIAEIQRLTKNCNWKHIPTHLNPADRISRGMLPSQIVNDELWWHGPSFLTKEQDFWPDTFDSVPEECDLQKETRSVITLHANVDNFRLFDRFSELSKIIKTIAFCYRFYNNASRRDSKTGSLDRENALKVLERLAQREEFPLEIQIFEKNQIHSNNTKPTGLKSQLKNLNLFMDQFGLLRINGRLLNMKAPYDTRFPILLPANHKISWLIMRSFHVRTLHAGPSLVLATVRQRFWPLRGRQLARKIVRQCITCFRINPKTTQQLMAPLPSARLNPARVFSRSGLDYCGPFLVRPLSGRGASVKKYVALFVCLAVKAVHLEIVADLSTVACINAVKRFVSRRGRVFEIYCDNATAFVGADRELQTLRRDYLKQFRSTEWSSYCLSEGIQFRFIPARSPHFGGLWEAGIKSFKYHFRRTIGCRSFNMDQFHTVVAQIEAILNSRPLCPMSDNPEDISALTPGHFLVGEPLFSIPEPDLGNININRLSRFQEIRRSVQDLWRCWSRDYVNQLQQRSKWKTTLTDVQNGQLVLMKQDNVPPLQWPLARIIQTIPGKDGHVRVVIVQTTNGKYRRAITEVAILPIECDANNVNAN